MFIFRHYFTPLISAILNIPLPLYSISLIELSWFGKVRKMYGDWDDEEPMDEEEDW